MQLQRTEFEVCAESAETKTNRICVPLRQKAITPLAKPPPEKWEDTS